ncbi:unnamed protein product [Dovyalis caffra]|uniref:Uncharacterized protein n=1 Tax=Dovyalis caffra TaxID=77055 RepID=A0AAV1RBJ2_9ROSI|nr:unnamed protein product [Dovyalis caffra]
MGEHGYSFDRACFPSDIIAENTPHLKPERSELPSNKKFDCLSSTIQGQAI